MTLSNHELPHEFAYLLVSSKGRSSVGASGSVLGLVVTESNLIGTVCCVTLCALAGSKLVASREMLPLLMFPEIGL